MQHVRYITKKKNVNEICCHQNNWLTSWKTHPQTVTYNLLYKFSLPSFSQHQISHHNHIVIQTYIYYNLQNIIKFRYISICARFWFFSFSLSFSFFMQGQIFAWIPTNRRSTDGSACRSTGSCSTGWEITATLARGSGTNNFKFSTKVHIFPS